VRSRCFKVRTDSPHRFNHMVDVLSEAHAVFVTIQSWCDLKFVYTKKIITHRCYVTPATTVKDCKLGTSNLPTEKKSLNLIHLIHVTGVKGKYWIASISCIHNHQQWCLGISITLKFTGSVQSSGGLIRNTALSKLWGRRIFPINAGIQP
jgi:hypothetical protein